MTELKYWIKVTYDKKYTALEEGSTNHARCKSKGRC